MPQGWSYPSTWPQSQFRPDRASRLTWTSMQTAIPQWNYHEKVMQLHWVYFCGSAPHGPCMSLWPWRVFQIVIIIIIIIIINDATESVAAHCSRLQPSIACPSYNNLPTALVPKFTAWRPRFITLISHYNLTYILGLNIDSSEHENKIYFFIFQQNINKWYESINIQYLRVKTWEVSILLGERLPYQT